MTSSFTKKEFCTHKCYVYVFPVSVIILFDFGIVPTMWCFLLFISLYIHLYFGIYWFSLRLVDDDMFNLWLPVFLIQAFVLIFPFVFMLYLSYILFCLWMLVLKFNLYSVSYCSLREWYLNLVLDCSLREPYLNFFSDCSLCELYMYFVSDLSVHERYLNLVSSSTSRKENQ